MSTLTADRARPDIERMLGDIAAPKIGPSSTMAEFAAAVFAKAAKVVAEREQALRENGDPDDVHDTRVAIRRLRAELRTIRPLLDRAWVDQFNTELKWLAAALGEVRDTDVRIEELHGHVLTLPEQDAAGGRILLGRLHAQREEANARLLAALDSERYRMVVAQIVAAAGDPPLRSGSKRTDAPAKQTLPPLVAKRWKRLRRDVRELGDQPSDPALHEVRKDAKKLRYAAEASEPVAGTGAAKLAQAAEAMQDTLGEVHDAAEAQHWLRHESLAAGSVEVAVAAGELIEREGRRYHHYRERWPKVWRKESKKRNRAWLKASAH